MRKKFVSIERITKATLQRLPKDKPGVYGIFTRSGRLQKVGRAKRGRLPERILESVREIRERRREAVRFGVILTNSVEEAKRLETFLIRRRKPPFNKEQKGK